MTKIVIKRNDYGICSFELSGHSGFADKGSDILCSSITTAAFTTLNILDKICGTAVKYTQSEAYLKFDVDYHKLTTDDIKYVKIVLANLEEYFDELVLEYADYLKLIKS